MRRKQKSNTESFALSKPRLILKDDGSRLVDADAREQCGEGGDIQDVTRQNHSVTTRTLLKPLADLIRRWDNIPEINIPAHHLR